VIHMPLVLNSQLPQGGKLSGATEWRSIHGPCTAAMRARTAQTLTVELHRLGSPLQDLAVAHLCQILTESETLFPTTNLRLIFRQIGSS